MGMTTESVAVNKDLIIAQQEASLLKLQLQNLQGKKVSVLEDSLFSPALFEHYQMIAHYLAKSGIVPKNFINKPDDIFIAMAMGYKLGFSPEQSLLDIAVINGRPCVWGDGVTALVYSHPDCEKITEVAIYDKDGAIFGWTCTVKRKGNDPHSITYTLKDAEEAELLKKPGPWQQHRSRMLQMRARRAIKDKFSDALRGLGIREIAEDDANVIDGEYIAKPTQTDKLKTQLQADNKVVLLKDSDHKSTRAVIDNDYDDLPDLLLQIEKLMQVKNFTEERRKKAFDYFKISALEELTQEQAARFVMQLSNS